MITIKKILVAILFANSFAVNTYAQELTVVSATKQPWDGGVAEHYGTDYFITFTPVIDGIVFDLHS